MPDTVETQEAPQVVTEEAMVSEILSAQTPGNRVNPPSTEEPAEPTDQPDAPTDTNPDEAVESGQPEGDTGTEPEKATEEAKPVEAEPTPEEKPTDELDIDGDSELRDLIGLSETEPQSLESLQKKYRESSQEGHRLAEELREVREMLSAKNVEIIRTKDGKIDLKATKAYADIADEDIPAIDAWSDLTRSEREALENIEDVDAKTLVNAIAQKAYKQATVDELSKRPIVTDEVPVNQISELEMDKCITELQQMKLADGKTPRFPDSDKSYVINAMATRYNDPAMESKRAWMLENPQNFLAGLQDHYNAIKIALLTRELAKRNADAQLRQKTEEQKKEASTASKTGSQTNLQALQNTTSPNAEQSEIDKILSAGQVYRGGVGDRRA